MNRYVVSSQRSGFNWLRFCIETFYGKRTPGQKSVLSKEECPELAFRRSHDALNLSPRSRRGKTSSWAKFDPEKMDNAKVLLIVRDPLESFVRMAEFHYPKYASYVSNIKFYEQAKKADRKIAYYEDIVASPAAMYEAMEFLEIKPAAGYAQPTAQDVENRWDELGQLSRSNYDAKQSGTGGAHTKDNPTDFRYHQRKLNPKEAARVWRYLNSRLTEAEMELLARYRPEGAIAPLTIWDRFKFLRA
ncbi:hypothetical protein OU789_01255 [Halocynthiibacter sp. C4]|uniref:hypothetical protein n=1 Tax=Halocynthiibacter sp. C4 TaxID=2992758 RepID=UPI00237C40B4|nr:hypothetical protein [Halocynthiibacter sp. C4]MDE0588548.1 hypothetical protein [Halocynthiibacter sp. C4]